MYLTILSVCGDQISGIKPCLLVFEKQITDWKHFRHEIEL